MLGSCVPKRDSYISKKDAPFGTLSDEVIETEAEARDLQQSTDSRSALPSAIAVPVAPPPPPTTVVHSTVPPHGTLSTKNQMRGGSFWRADQVHLAAPHADAVQLNEDEESSDPSQRSNQSEFSFLNLLSFN